MEDIANLDEPASITNAIQGSENKRKLSTTSIYLKPTTMRGIPLVSLIPSPIVRGFYITKSENNLPSSILADSSTPSYTTIDTPVEQMETTLISDTSTIDEAATIAHNNQIESKVALDENVNDIVSDKGVDNTERYSTTSSSVTFSKDSGNVKNVSNREKSDSITIPVDISVSKRRKSLRNFNQATPLPSFYVASSTTPTRRRIALAVSKYSESTTPLWTGRRVVAKKRIRMTVSPIKNAIRQTESDFIHAVTNSPRNTSPLARSASTLISRRRKPPMTSTIPTISSVVPDSMEIFNVHDNLANSYNTKTEEPEDHATVEIAETSINSETAATSPISNIISTANDLATDADISTFSNDPTTMTVPAIANASVTTAPSIVAVAKAPAVTTDATITTASAITGIEVEPTSLNYSVIDNPAIENTDAIPTDSAATIAFVEDTKTEITSPSVNIVPETARATATDPVTRSTIESIEIERASTMTDYSAITIPDTTNAQEIATDLENTIRTQITNADIGATSTIADYSMVTSPTSINMHAKYDDTTDATSITAANAEDEIETASTIENYSAFTTTAVKNTTTIPVTTSPVTTTASPLTMAISSTVNTQHMHATAPMTTSDLADANTVTTNTMTTPFSTIIPTITDLNVIRTSANANIPSTFAIDETTPITVQPETISVTSSKTPITSEVVTSTNSAAPPSSTIEFSTIRFADPNNLEFTSDFEVTTTAESTAETTEIPTTFETPPTFTSTATTFSKPLHSTNFETSSIGSTVALSTQEDNSFLTSKVTQTSSSLPSIATSIINKATVPLERSTTSATLSGLGESITINPTIQTTTNAYDANSVQTISEESTMSEQKTDFKKVTPMETQSQTEDQITVTINKPSSAQMINERFTTPEMKIVSEETTSKTVQNRKQNQSSELDTTNYYSNQKTATRRVVNRTNNWHGSASPTLQRTNQYPRQRVAAYRGRPRRPPTDTSSSRVVEKNRRRRVMQKRVRVNLEAFNSTVTPDSVNIQNITEDHVAYDRIENGRRMKVVLKKIKEKVEEKTTTILPIEETTMFLQASTAIENKTLQVQHENENIEEKQKIIPEKIKQPQESFTTEKTSTNSSNESLSDNSQSNLHVGEDLSQKPRKIMKVLKNVRPQSEEKNSIEEASANSVNTNSQNNFTKSPYPDKNLSDKRTTRGRMRVVLKNIKPKSEEKNSTIEEINVASNSIDKSFQNNHSNNVNVSQNFSNEEKPRRRTRVLLKRVKSKSEEGGTKTESNSEYDSTNESLQGTFSNNFYSAKNFPVQYVTRRRMRVALKNVKPKSEEKNSTVEETTADSNSTNENLQSTFLNNFRNGKNLPVEYGTRRRMRVVLKSVKPKSEERNSTVEKTTTDPNSNNTNFQGIFLNNSRRGKNLPVKYGTKRRRVVLKSVKPKSEERNSTTKETSIDSDSTDLQGSFSSNLYINENLSNEEEARRGAEVVLKNVKPKERDSVAEETSTDSDFAGKDPKVLYTFHFSSNLHVGDNLPDKKKKHSKSEEKEAMIERQEDTKTLQTTRTSVPVEKDTDRPSLEVKNTGSISRNPGSGQSNRHRKPTPFTTSAPLINTLSNTLTTRRRGRPVETTLSPRIDFVDALEDTESYVKPTTLHDQNTDVSDQSIRAQEYAVTLSDPPSSSSDIGRTPLRDVDRRKISTTIAPRTDSTTSRTVSRYDASLRSRQRPRAKDRPTVNATTRPRRPPVVDYDYYEDETPIIVADRSVLNSKLFLTSKGTVRCLDQGNFPHPYSCKKFITCARMVNGQVIGTEYTCPDKLSFDPIGGICNWSAGLGCKD